MRRRDREHKPNQYRKYEIENENAQSGCRGQTVGPTDSDFPSFDDRLGDPPASPNRRDFFPSCETHIRSPAVVAHKTTQN